MANGVGSSHCVWLGAELPRNNKKLQKHTPTSLHLPIAIYKRMGVSQVRDILVPSPFAPLSLYSARVVPMRGCPLS